MKEMNPSDTQAQEVNNEEESDQCSSVIHSR